MANDYRRQINTANKLIKRYGVSGKWISVSQVTPDPLKPWEVIFSETEYTITITLLPTNRDFKDFSHLPKYGANIEGQYLGFMTAQVFAPKIGDYFVSNNSGKFSLRTLDKVDPNDGSVIIWIMEFES